MSVIVQPALLQLVVGVFEEFVGVPVESVTVMCTSVPRHTKIRLDLMSSEAGLMMFPVMKCATLALFD
jgi:hypothetical protein